MGAVIFLLMIVSANLANLMLAWAASRSREMAVRTALGATRTALTRQVLFLSLMLSLAGAALGALIATGSVAMIKNFSSVRIPRLDEISVDLRVLLFLLGVSLSIGLIFSLVPVIKIWYFDVGEALKSATPTSTGNRGRIRSLLVVSEIAFSVILLVGAGLLIQTLYRLQHVDLGFKVSNMLTTRIFLPQKTYSDSSKRINFWRSLVENTSHLPGVESTAIVTELPLSGQDNPTAFTARTKTGDSFVFKVRGISPGYFNLMGIPLKAGRTLTNGDQPNTEHVVVLNEAGAHIFGSGNPIGEELTFDFGPYTAHVVGVVGNIRHASVASSPDREAYFPMPQTPLLAYSLAVRTVNNPESLTNPVREVLRKLDPDQSVGAFHEQSGGRTPVPGEISRVDGCSVCWSSAASLLCWPVWRVKLSGFAENSRNRTPYGSRGRSFRYSRSLYPAGGASYWYRFDHRPDRSFSGCRLHIQCALRR